MFDFDRRRRRTRQPGLVFDHGV